MNEKKIFASLTMIEFSLNKRKSSFEVKSTNHYFWAVQYFWKKEVATKNRKILQKKSKPSKSKFEQKKSELKKWKAPPPSCGPYWKKNKWEEILILY